jgi:hypothetical protein
MLGFYETFDSKDLNEEDTLIDEKVKEEMKNNITKKLIELDDKIQDAEKNMGENEVREGLLAKAQYYKQIGDKVRINNKK